MDARIYQLDDMRSQHNSRMLMEKFFQMPMTSDGLALLVSATSFWVEYGARMASFHHKILSAGFSPYLKSPKETGNPFGWRL